MNDFLDRVEPGLLVGLLIPIAGMVLVAYLVYLALHFRQQRNDKLMETVQRLADRGQPIPPWLLDPPERSSTPFYGAMTLVGVGVGLMLMFYTMNLSKVMGIGLMVACIGVAQLIALAIESRRRDRRENRHAHALPPAAPGAPNFPPGVPGNLPPGSR